LIAQNLHNFLQIFWPRVFTFPPRRSWFRGRNGTKNIKIFTREFPQDNINASFLKPKIVENKSMGFVSRKKMSQSWIPEPHESHPKIPFQECCRNYSSTETIPKTITIDDYIPKKISKEEIDIHGWLRQVVMED
jgi:hypothetical protein